MTVRLRDWLLAESGAARQVWQQLRDQAGPRLATGARARGSVAVGTIMDVAYDRIADMKTTGIDQWIDEAVRQPVANAARVTTAAVESALHRAVEQDLSTDILSWVRNGTYDSVVGPRDCIRLALVDYLGQTVPGYRQAHAADLESYGLLAATAGWWWPFRTFAVLTDRPRLLPAGPPAGTSPAGWVLRYADGLTAP